MRKYLQEDVAAGREGVLVSSGKIELQVAGAGWRKEGKNLAVSFHFYGFRGAEDFIIAVAGL